MDATRKTRIVLRAARDEAIRRARNAVWYGDRTEGNASAVWRQMASDYVREARELNRAIVRA